MLKPGFVRIDCSIRRKRGFIDLVRNLPLVCGFLLFVGRQAKRNAAVVSIA